MQQPPPTGRTRPQGVTILAILAAISGVLGLFGGVVLLGLGGLAAAGAPAGGLVLIGAIIVLVASVLALAFAYGAWTLKPWAWTLGIAAEVLSLVSSGVAIVGGGSITNQIFSIVIAVAILYYLFTPNVKAAFGRT